MRWIYKARQRWEKKKEEMGCQRRLACLKYDMKGLNLMGDFSFSCLNFPLFTVCMNVILALPWGVLTPIWISNSSPNYYHTSVLNLVFVVYLISRKKSFDLWSVRLCSRKMSPIVQSIQKKIIGRWRTQVERSSGIVIFQSYLPLFLFQLLQILK